MSIKNTVTKYTISVSTFITLSALVALTGTSSWGAAADQPITPADEPMGPIGEPVVVSARERMANDIADAAQSGDAAKVNQLALIALAANTPFDDLPDEVLELIAGFLKVETLKQLAQVSKRWNQIATHIPLYHNSRVRKIWQDSQDRQLIQHYINYYHNPNAALYNETLYNAALYNVSSFNGIYNSHKIDRHRLIKLLIKRGANINEIYESSSPFLYKPKLLLRGTPLLQAIYNNNERVVTILLAEKADPNLSIDNLCIGKQSYTYDDWLKIGRIFPHDIRCWHGRGPTPLQLALTIEGRNEQIVTELLKAGAEANTSVLIPAINYRDPQAIIELLNAGIVPNEEAMIQAAQIAYQTGDTRIADLLINAGANVDAALQIALNDPSQRYRYAAEFLLVYRGANTDLLSQRQLEKLNAWHLVMGAPGALENTERLRTLLEQERTKKEAQTWYGETEEVKIARQQFEAARKAAVTWAVQQVQKQPSEAIQPLSQGEVRMALELARSQLADAQVATAGIAGRSAGWIAGWTPEQIAQADQEVVEAQQAVDILTQATDATEGARGAAAGPAAPIDMPEQPREPSE